MKAIRLLSAFVALAAAALSAGAEQARPLPRIPETLVQIRLDKGLTDSAGVHSVKRYVAKSGSLSTLRSPKFTDEGLLLTDAVSPDVKVPDFANSYQVSEHFSVALRMRLPKGLCDYAPVTLTPAKAGQEPLVPFLIDGDSIRIHGSKNHRDEKSWWSNPLPLPDRDGYTTIIYNRIGSTSVRLFVGDRLYSYDDKVELYSKYNRLVISPADSLVLCDLVVYKRALEKDDRSMVNGYDRGYEFEFGEKDEEGTIEEYTRDENARYNRWIIIDIAMIVITLGLRLRKRRRIVAFRFVGIPIFVLAIIFSIAVEALVYMPGGLTLKFWMWIASLAAYLAVAWAPVDREELEKDLAEEEEEQAARRRRGDSPSVKSRAGAMLGRLVLGGLYTGMSAFEGAKRDVVTVDSATGRELRRESSVDVQSFFSTLMASVLTLFAYIAILGFVVFLCIRLILWILPWTPVFFFVVNTVVYILIERGIDRSK